VLAARLIGIDKSVAVIARGPHLEALRNNGLTLTGMTDSHQRVEAFGHPDEVDIDDDTVVMLTMKTNDTEAALDAAGARYDGLALICLQNGVHNERICAERGLNGYGAVVLCGGRILEPGKVVHTAGSRFDIGALPRGVDEVCERVVDDLVAAGLKGHTHEEIMAAKWAKLVRNLNNATLALTDLPIQVANRFEESRRFMADVTAEALDVLEAGGVELEPAGRRTPREEVARMREPGEFTHIEIPEDPEKLARPSTWQDLHFQRGQVEVEYFNGEIVRLGERLGIATPLNHTVMERCLAAAAAKELPGGETIESLRATAGVPA